MLILKRPWTRQPQTPTRLAQPTAGEWAITGSQPRFNAATGAIAPWTNDGGGACVQRPTPLGMALHGPLQSWPNYTIDADWGRPGTVDFFARVNAVDANWGGLFGKRSSGNSLQFSVGRHASNDNLIFQGGSDAILTGTSITGLIAAGFIAGSCVVDGANVLWYQSGELVSGPIALGGSLASGTGTLILSNWEGANDAYDSDVDWLFFRWRPVVASAASIRALHANMWAAFAPLSIPIPTAAVAASTYTLSSATYAPGSITSTGVTPRVTVTVA